VTGNAASAGVGSLAKNEAKNVTAETRREVRALYRKTTSELSDQVSTQQKRAAQGLLTLSHQLGTMASRSQDSGIATDLTHGASQQIARVGHWLDTKEPGDVVNEVKEFARSKPGTFMALAAGVGLLAGRLTRGLAGEASYDSPTVNRDALTAAGPTTEAFPVVDQTAVEADLPGSARGTDMPAFNSTLPTDNLRR
jgi:ElaB/YqjD/DUF883 family membrane-anchored ribosome-binding protein